VDFSTPTAAMSLITAAASKSFPLVIGTTGFSTAEKKVIEDASKLVAIVLSPNMSIGTNLLFKLVRETAAILGDAYDAEIIEAHHRFKRDAPSGTAKRLAQIISKVYEKDVDVVATHGRKGDHLERKPNEIGIHSIRAGDIVAEHTVLFSTLGERLELTHRVHNRITFARGALLAARFAFTALPGLYDMQDVLDMST
jgi:4-hydroxy-tetrahydrodipicolinate reductase